MRQREVILFCGPVSSSQMPLLHIELGIEIHRYVHLIRKIIKLSLVNILRSPFLTNVDMNKERLLERHLFRGVASE